MGFVGGPATLPSQLPYPIFYVLQLHCKHQIVYEFSLSLPLERFSDTVFDGVGLAGFNRAGQMLFYWLKLLYPCYSLLLFFPFFSSCLYRLVLWDWGLQTDSGVYHSLSALHCRSILIIIITIHHDVL